MDELVAQVIAAGAGFLIAVLWFDLMFDGQVWRHRESAEVLEGVLASIAAYDGRVTTTASPMGWLVALAMLVVVVSHVVQAVDGDVPAWVSAASIGAALAGMGLAAVRVFGRAQRLGRREDSAAAQGELARSILRDHVVCVASMVTLLAVQLIGA